MIVFDWVRWKNLLSTGKEWTKINLTRSSNTLITGRNGSGKSTLLDALTFVLFGVAFREINKPQIINSVIDKDMVIEIAFHVGPKQYRVVRGMKPSVFDIYIDEVLLKQNAVPKDYQLYLEENILGFNYSAFTQIVILGNSSFISFMKLTAAKRREIIEDLLDIQIFSAMNKVVKEKVQGIKNKDGNLQREIVGVKAQIELQQKHVKDSEANNQEQIEKLKEEKKSKLTRREELDSVIAGLYSVSKELNAQVQVNKKAFDKKMSQLNTFEVKITANMNAQIADVNFYESNDICPTCTQSIDITFKNEALTKKKVKIEEYEKALVELRNEKSRMRDVREGHLKTETHLTDINKGILESENEIKWIDTSVDVIENNIRELSTKKVLSEEMIQISRNLVQKLTDLTEDQKKNQNEKLYYDAAAILLKDNGIKAKIVKQYLPVINKLINKYLAVMDFNINFEIDSEFNECVRTRHKEIFSYGNFSDGEKKRIDLALIFTWREVAKMKNSMDTNLLIMDELLDGALDNIGVDEVMKLINSFGKETNIFVITPKQDVLVDKFKELIKFEKHNNFSRMV